MSQRVYCLECSPFGKHNTKDLTKEIRLLESGLRHCTKCGRDLPESEFYPKRNSYTTWCKECFKSDVINRSIVGKRIGSPKKYNDGLTHRERRKLFAINYLGGKCSNPECRYHKCPDALEFHHKNPEEKDFQISVATKTYMSDEELMKELDKCVLLCSNCHKELHYKLRRMKKGKKKNVL